jgi:tripartite ATP-independent transporter DctP family solute receptor
MKAKLFRRISLVCIIFAVFVASSTIQAKVTTLTVAHAVAEGNPYHLGAVYFKEQIEKRTNGQIQVKVYPAGQLGGELEIIQGMQLGTIDLGVVASAPVSRIEPKFQLFDLPFMFTDYEHVDKVFQGEIGEYFSGLLGKHGLKVMGWMESGMQGFYNTKRPIKSISDIRGLSMRVMESPVLVNAMNAYGAKAVTIPFPEFYGAMQQRVVDGGENAVVTYYTSKHCEVAKYYTKSDHKFLPAPFLMSTASFDRIPKEYRSIVEAVGREAARHGALAYRELEETYLRAARDEYGVNVVILTEATKQEFRSAVAPVVEDTLKRTGMADTYKAIQQLR